MKMKNIRKSGITIVTLVITVIILTVLTGAVMLTTNNSDIFGQTQTTIDEHNKQAMIEQIQMKIQKERLAKINRGETGFTIKEDAIPVVKNFGTYEDDTLKLTTTTNEIEIYLYEILDIHVEEYITAVYKDKQFTLTEKEESLSSNGYKYEYTYDNGVIWQTYTNPTTIQEQSGIKVRLVNSEGKVISNEYVVTKGAGEETINKIKAITITNAPTKTTYKQGETFNSLGMQITVTYEDNTSKVVTNYNYTPTRALTVSDRYVTISYTENGITKKTTQNITVTNNLTGIAILTEPTRTEYRQGESFDKTGMVVRALYEDNTSKQITNYTVTPTILTSSDTIVTITYQEGNITQTATQDIKVAYLEAIEVTQEPAKVTYIKGENFDKTEMTISAIYKYVDGASYGLPVENYQITNGTNLQEGTIEIVIRYEEGGITKETKQIVTVTNNITGITVTTLPNKTTYNHDEEFDKTGMVVTLNYQNTNDNRALQESEYTVSTPTYGQNYVTITHTETGMTTTQAITVNRVLLSIDITKAPNTTKYIVGDKFNIEGMVVTATYNNGDMEDVTKNCTFSPTIDTGLTINDTSITITYDDKTTSQEIDVKDTLGNQITKDNYGQTVNYIANGKTDWQIYYREEITYMGENEKEITEDIIFLIASSSIGDTSFSANGDVVTANKSNVYKIMKLGQTGYTLNSSYNNSKRVANLVNNYSGYANIDGYKDTNGISYVIGAIGGPTMELVQARANTISLGALTLGISTTGYTMNGTTYGYVTTGIPESSYIWIASPSTYLGGDYVYRAYDAHISNISTNPAALCPVVALKASIPAYWNGTYWEI